MKSIKLMDFCYYTPTSSPTRRGGMGESWVEIHDFGRMRFGRRWKTGCSRRVNPQPRHIPRRELVTTYPLTTYSWVEAQGTDPIETLRKMRQRILGIYTTLGQRGYHYHQWDGSNRWKGRGRVKGWEDDHRTLVQVLCNEHEFRNGASTEDPLKFDSAYEFYLYLVHVFYFRL